jgi:hypothetical protein
LDEASDLDPMPTVFIKHFPSGRPGAPTSVPPHHSTAGSGVTRPGNSIWAPFGSQRDWAVARWVKTNRITSSAFSEFLAIPEVREAHINFW